MNTIQSLQASDVAKRQSLNNHPSTWLLLLRRILALGLVAVPLAALPISLSAGELKDQAQEKKAPSTLTGRIISVDKSLRSLAVEIKGTILRVNVTSLVRISKKGKLAGIEDLAPGPRCQPICPSY